MKANQNKLLVLLGCCMVVSHLGFNQGSGRQQSRLWENNEEIGSHCQIELLLGDRDGNRVQRSARHLITEALDREKPPKIMRKGGILQDMGLYPRALTSRIPARLEKYDSSIKRRQR